MCTFLPFVFMLATTVWAGSLNILHNYLPRGDFQGYLNVGLTGVMIGLVLYVAWVGCRSWLALSAAEPAALLET